MNNILDEITYSDGRIEDGCRCSFVDSPAKLKLRARTFDGINRSIKARRSPVIKENEFSVPSAFMAIDIPNSDDAAGESKFSVPNAFMASQESATEKEYVQTDFDGSVPIKPVTAAKRLKVTRDKKETMIKNYMFNQAAVPVSDEVVNEDVNKEEVSENVVPTVMEVVPQVEEVKVVDAEGAVVPEQVEKVPEEKEDVKSKEEQPNIDSYLNGSYNNSNIKEEKQNDPVEEAVQGDIFKRLENSSQEHIEADKLLQESVALKEAKKEELEASRRMYEQVVSEKAEKTAELQESRVECDSMIKELEEYRRLNLELDRKFEIKIKKIKDATLKKKQARKKEEEEYAALVNEKKEFDAKIENENQEVLDLNKQNEELNKEKEEVSKNLTDIRDVYEKRLGVYNGVTVPGEEMEFTPEIDVNAEVEPQVVVADEVVSNNNVIPFPNFNLEQAIVNNEEDKVLSKRIA